MNTPDFAADDRGVSPVIGVILMVAITVILAAVIGTFVLNLGGSVQENVQAGANVDCNGGDSTIKITWTSNQNADRLILSAGDNTTGYVWASQSDAVLESVGENANIPTTTGNTFAGNDTVDVTITGVSGSTSTVVSTKTCEF